MVSIDSVRTPLCVQAKYLSARMPYLGICAATSPICSVKNGVDAGNESSGFVEGAVRKIVRKVPRSNRAGLVQAISAQQPRYRQPSAVVVFKR